MRRLRTAYVIDCRLHAVIDDQARLVHLYRLPGRIAKNAIIVREMMESLFDGPGISDDVLYLDAFGLLRVVDYIGRTSRPETTDASRARRFSRLVRSAGFRDDMLRVLHRLGEGRFGEGVGEGRVFEALVLDQMRTACDRYQWLAPMVSPDDGDRGQSLVGGIIRAYGHSLN